LRSPGLHETPGKKKGRRSFDHRPEPVDLRLVHGDGHAGLDKAAPFQGIIVAAAARAVPEALERQIARGGRMILPLHGSHRDAQRLVLIERSGRGLIESELDPVRFVPLEAGKA